MGMKKTLIIVGIASVLVIGTGVVVAVELNRKRVTAMAKRDNLQRITEELIRKDRLMQDKGIEAARIQEEPNEDA